MSYCGTCNNTGYVDCYCGGDLCLCGEEEVECPDCHAEDCEVCGENHGKDVPLACETGDGV